MQLNIQFENGVTVQELINILQKIPDKTMNVVMEYTDPTDYLYKTDPVGIEIGDLNADSSENLTVDEMNTKVVLIKCKF